MRLIRVSLWTALIFASTVMASGQTRVFIDPADLPADPGGQQNPVWCWAASISYIFAYYQHAVSQCQIVSKFYGVCPPVPGNPKTMGTSLNSAWTDTKGEHFDVKANITDEYWNTAHDVDNTDVINALENDNPVFYATTSHAMVLLSVTYMGPKDHPFITEGIVWDPNPVYHQNGGNGIRTVKGSDLQARYVAIPAIPTGNTDKKVPVDEPVVKPDKKLPEPDSGDFCDVLKTITDDAVNGFSSLGNGTIKAKAEQTDTRLPTAERCSIAHHSVGNEDRKRFNCGFADGSYEAVLKKVKACLNADNGYTIITSGAFAGKSVPFVQVTDFNGAVSLHVDEFVAQPQTQN